jgi:hypothetical protein
MVHVSRRSFVQGTAGLFVVFSLPRASAASTTTVLVTIGRLFIHSHRAREATWQLNKAGPVEALRSWMTAAGITSGAVFRPVTKGQHVLSKAAQRRVGASAAMSPRAREA